MSKNQLTHSRADGVNSLIRTTIIICDVALVNILLVGIFWLVPDRVSPYFAEHKEIIYLVFNLSTIIVSMLVPHISHKRFINYSRLYMHILKTSMLITAVAFVSLLSIVKDTGILSFFVSFFILLSFSLMVVRTLEIATLKHLRIYGRNRIKMVFIGHDIANKMLMDDIMQNPSSGIFIVGYYADKKIENLPPFIMRLGGLQDVYDTAALGVSEGKGIFANIDEVACSLSHSEEDHIRSIISFCENHCIRFYYVPRMSGNFHLRLHPESFGRYIVFSNISEPLTMPANAIAKRLFDIAFSGLVLLCLLPFLPIIALIIKIQSPGPIFFKQKRTGYTGVEFECYKFRSMHVNVDSDKMQATEDDPRKFPFGNFMRKASIDELPQFFNVLKGDMSVVGPRPHMLYHTETYSEIINNYMVRHYCKPGITGWAQVTGFRGETKEQWQMEERVKHDIWYIENWSVFLDLKIIFMTVWGVFVHDKQAY